MNFVRLLPVIFSALLLAAHFSRAGNNGLVMLCLVAPFVLISRRKFILYIISGLLVIGSIVWISTLVSLVQIRIPAGIPSLRMAIILGVVALLTALSAMILKNKKLHAYYNHSSETARASAVGFFLTALILSIVHVKIELPLLLLERFFPGTGWIEIFVLSLYAAWIIEKMLNPASSAIWRRRIWLLFSIVFFGQLALGLVGFEKFLMTGSLHLPIPAMIIAGPLYRWELGFMVFLFAGTILLVGPAWCSHLCYFGGWDLMASQQKRKPTKLPQKNWLVQIFILILIIASAILLSIAGVPSLIATILGILFGLTGVGFIVFWSRRKGVMTHCVSYCPIALPAVWLGKISPFRIRMNDKCTDCGICRLSCRYNALNLSDIKKRKPANSCTLCGDCITSCDEQALEYRFLKLMPGLARTLFIVLVISLHAAFLGLARI